MSYSFKSFKLHVSYSYACLHNYSYTTYIQCILYTLYVYIIYYTYI